MRRSTLVLLFSGLLLWAGGLRVWYAWVGPHGGRFYDERFTLRNLERATVDGELLRPANAYYPGLSWLPIAAVYRASETVATWTGDERLRTFRGGRATATAYRLGRSTSVLYGLLALLVLYRIGAFQFDASVGLLAAFLLAATYLHLRLSGMLKPESLLLLTTLLAVWLALRAAEHPSLARFLLAGGAVGLTLSAKYNGGPVAFGLVGLTVVLLGRRRWRALGWLVAAGVLAAAVFLALNPWAVTAPELLARAFEVHEAQYRFRAQVRAGGESWRQLPFLLQLVTGPLGHGPVLGALGLAALPLFGWKAGQLGWRTPRGRGLVVVLASAAGYGVLYAVASQGNLKTANWLPLLPWTSLGAAWLLVAAWRALRARVPGLRRAAAQPLAAGILILAIALPATAMPYRKLLPSTSRLATVLVGNRLAPDFHRILVAEVTAPDVALRRGPDSLGLLGLADFKASAFSLDGADAELFPAARLRGPYAAFYRGRMERVEAPARLAIRPRLFRVHGPSLVAIVHGWRATGRLGAGRFELDVGDSGVWRTRLAEEYRDRIVSLELLLPARGATQARPRLDLAGGAVECVRLAERGRDRHRVRCLKFHATEDGTVTLRAAVPEEGARHIDYIVREWRRPRELRRGVAEQAGLVRSRSGPCAVPAGRGCRPTASSSRGARRSRAACVPGPRAAAAHARGP